MENNVNQRQINKKTLNFTVEGEEWDKLLKQAKNRLIRDLKVTGFRKGHIPEEVANKYINEQDVFSNAVNVFSQKKYEELANNNEINNDNIFFDSCKIHVKDINTKKLEVVFEFDLQPTINLIDYKNINIPMFDASCTEEELKREKETILKDEIMLIPKKNEIIENGDTVTFDFKGFIDEKPFEGGEAKFFELEIGSKQFIPGFEEQMVGLKKTQSSSINVMFPPNYPHKDFAGKAAKFEILIHDIKVKEYPTINQELIQKLKINDVNNIEQFNEYLKNLVINNKKDLYKQQCVEKIFQEISNKSSLSYFPGKILKEEVNRIKDYIKQKSKEKGVSVEDFVNLSFPEIQGTMEDKYVAIAKNNIVLMFAIRKLISTLNINVNENDINNYFQNLAQEHRVPVEEVKKHMSNKLEQVENYLLRDKLVDELIRLNKVNQ